ncbi:hypothetical protein DFH09DRAFT_1426882 [Mycena vulgaris]|nr:hypothetical protein DFH09DRAFT_1426882 [Mycena vulgaris]
MPLFNLFQSKVADPEPNKASFAQPPGTSGLIVTSELDEALEECKATVSRIAKECRAKNRKFRDIEFDLENDREACLYGLSPISNVQYPHGPPDVRRVNQIFETPQFFVDGANSNDIVQGQLGDCWFLSALATMSTADGLVEKFCVARDEEIGIYGFIFYKTTTGFIAHSLLYTAIPKFEELNVPERILYHNDKEHYNKSARKGSQSLYFARSGTEGETWVPLIEKAYAKLHGDYASLCEGYDCEGVEDLTGGISSYIQTKDILSIDKFWTEELLNANKDRIFGCSFRGLDGSRSGNPDVKISGLFGNHAYSVLRAVEAKGKWFVVIPDLTCNVLDSDFLDCWDQIDRTLLFDSNWITSSQWLRVTTRPLHSAWTFGDVCFTITIPKPSFTIIVLSQLNFRFFKDVSGPFDWSFDFLLFRRGQTEPLAMSSQPRFHSRSVNLELTLDAGDYVVHVRLDRHVRPQQPQVLPENNLEDSVVSCNKRKHSRLLTAKAQSQSIASNFKPESQASNLIIPVEALAGLNFSDMEKKAIEKAEAQKKEAEAAALNPTAPVVTTYTTTTTTVTTILGDGTKTVTTSDVVNDKPADSGDGTPVVAEDKKGDSAGVAATDLSNVVGDRRGAGWRANFAAPTSWSSTPTLPLDHSHLAVPPRPHPPAREDRHSRLVGPHEPHPSRLNCTVDEHRIPLVLQAHGVRVVRHGPRQRAHGCSPRIVLLVARHNHAVHFEVLSFEKVGVHIVDAGRNGGQRREALRKRHGFTPAVEVVMPDVNGYIL